MSARIFITGATGYLGSAIAKRFVRAGYTVHGLTRNSERVADLTSRGIRPVVGTLSKPDTFLATLKNCDAVVHTAFDSSDVVKHDQLALEAFRLGILDGRVRSLLYTSSIWVHGDTGGRVIDESAPLDPIDLVRWRAAHEDVAADLSEFETRVVVLRPGIVYGGSRGCVGQMFTEGHEQRIVHYPGNGNAFWAMIHRDDLAEGYLRAYEHARGGERYVLADGSQHTVREIAESVARVTGAQAQPRDMSEVLKQYGLLGRALLTSQKFDTQRAQHELGWEPMHASFVAEARTLDEDWLASRGTAVA